MYVTIEPLCRIDIYSHFFLVTAVRGRMMSIMQRFTHKYTKVEYVRSRSGFVRQPGQVFGHSDISRGEFRFHIGQLHPLVELFVKEYINPDFYEWYVHDLYVPSHADIKANPDYVLRPLQLSAVDFITAEDKPGDLRSRFISAPTGSGKSLSLDCKIRVPGGWVVNRDIREGDVVVAHDGSNTSVTGVYPQGPLPFVRLMFSDGRSSECSTDHLWTVMVLKGNDERHWETITADELKERMAVVSDVFYIPLSNGEHSDPIDFLYDSYHIGSLVGYKNRSNYRGGLSFDDPELARRDNLKAFMSLYLRTGVNDLSECDELLDMFEEQLKGSYEQRIDLLKGIFSTSEHRTELEEVSRGRYEFMTSCRRVAKVFVNLVRSLGGKAKDDRLHRVFKDRSKKRTLDGSIYVCSITLPDSVLSQLDPQNVIEDEDEFNFRDVLEITDVVEIGERDSQCISIDHPEQLFVMDDFIVTHNTVMYLSAIAQLKTKTIIAVLPRYVTKTIEDVLRITNTKPKEIVELKGGKSIKNFVGMMKDDDNPYKFAVVSLKTLALWYKAHERNPVATEEEYGCKPHKLAELFGAGQIAVDEAHEHLYAVYRLMIYSHVPKIIGLSGTMLSRDPFIDKMQKVMFPTEVRYEDIKMNKYIKAYAIEYSFDDFYRTGIRTTERGSTSYSHVAFEASIIRSRRILDGYLDLISYIVDLGWKDCMEGDRMVIFMGRVEMCGIVTEHLQRKHRNRDIRRFAEGDPYENMIEAEWRVTTVQSGGTAHDVPRLRVSIMTNNIQSPQANLQVLGRLRELKDRDVKFFWIWCSDIRKHQDYHQERIKLIQDRVQFIKEFRAPMVL